MQVTPPAAPLPCCPLCGNSPKTRGLIVSCTKGGCGLWIVSLDADEWRRLASPALPPSVVAVLEAATLWAECETTDTVANLQDNVEVWIAAGRPGLPETPREKP